MSKYRADGHPVDETGEPVHEDIDPFIPTGICAHCTGSKQDTESPEDRNTL